MTTASSGMLSVTDLSTYLYCARKLYLKKVLKLAEPVKEVMVLGTVRHLAFEGIGHAEELLAKQTEEKIGHLALFSLYKQEYAKLLRSAVIQCKKQLAEFSIPLEEAYSKAWPSIMREANARSQFVFNFMKQFQVYGEELWQQLTPKIESEVRFESPTVGLKGIVDQIEIYPDKLVPIELKTGKMPASGLWPGHKIQVGAYMVLIGEARSIPVTEGKIRYLDQGEERSVPFSPFVKIEVAGVVQKARETLRSSNLPPYVQPSKCKPCGLKEQCYDEALMAAKQREMLKT